MDQSEPVMNSALKTILLGVGILLINAPTQAQTWIWHGDGDGSRSFVRKQFHVSNRVRSAELRVCADDSAKVYLNGKALSESAGTSKPLKADVTSRLRLGRNVLAAEATNADGPRGVVALLIVTLVSGKRQIVATDITWKAAPHNSVGWFELEFDDSKWKSATMIAPHGAKPWGAVLLK